MHYFLSLLISLILIQPCCAQSAGEIDIEALGQPVVDDTLDLYDRYVYINQDAVSSNVSLGKSILSDQEVFDYVLKAVSDVMTLSRNDLVQKVEVANQYFTENGYQQYLITIRDANLKETLTQQGYNLRTIIPGDIEIFSKGIDSEDRYRWGIFAPVIMTYDKDGPGDEPQSFEAMLEMEIARMPIKQPGDTPIAIDYWVLKSNPQTDDAAQ